MIVFVTKQVLIHLHDFNRKPETPYGLIDIDLFRYLVDGFWVDLQPVNTVSITMLAAFSCRWPLVLNGFFLLM